MERVSVIIPVYNTLDYLEGSISSVINQTYQNIEIIIVSDGITPEMTNTLKAMALKESRIKLYHFNQKKGVAAFRNYGMEKATGEFIYFLDSDDFLPEETIELLVTYIGESDVILGKIRPTYLSSSFTLVFNGLFKPTTYTDNRFRLLKRNSILNMLIRKNFVDTHVLKSPEERLIYSDLSFLINILRNSNEVLYLEEAIYFHRRRNDPINNPSLSQMSSDKRINQFLQSYIDIKNDLTNEEQEADTGIDRHFLNYYRKFIVSHCQNREEIRKVYSLLSDAVQRLNSSIVNNYDWILKKEINAVKSGNEKKFTRVMSRHNFLRDFRKANTRRKKYILLYHRLFKKLPLKKKLMFFESFLGKNYSDSPKYIYEYMLKHHRDYRFVWSFNDETTIPGNAKQVKRFSLRYFYYLARAKYWVSNSRMPKYLTKREGNVYLQTWHGTPLKKLVFDMDEVFSADPKYKQNFYSQSRRWDFLSSPNQYASDIFRKAFLFDKEMLEVGYPRNDILYTKNNEQEISRLKKKMNLPLGKKVILYAPTWRDDDYFARGRYSFELQLDLEKMQQEIGDEYIVLLRMHYFIANEMNVSDFEGFVYDFSNYDDIAELYLVSDMLITDYSSVFFDYANLRRPILFYMYDLEKYQDKLRGFYLDVENEVPGPILKQTDEIISTIKNIDAVRQTYQRRYDAFYSRFCEWDDGRSTEKTVKRILNK